MSDISLLINTCTGFFFWTYLPLCQTTSTHLCVYLHFSYHFTLLYFSFFLLIHSDVPPFPSSPPLLLPISSFPSFWPLSAIINGSNTSSASCGDPQWQITGDTLACTDTHSLPAGLILPHNGTRLMFSLQPDKSPFVCLHIRDSVCVSSISDFLYFLGVLVCVCLKVLQKLVSFG